MTDAATFSTTTTIAISDAPRYMKQLCRHFGHKVEATFSDTEGRVEFGEGTALLTATDATTLAIDVRAAGAADAERYAQVVDRHLVKFAFREELTIAWSEPSPLTTA